MKVKIYTMTHRLFQKPDDQIYIPLHVGRALAEDLGYLGDDQGENISAWNSYYGELTGLYWIWKHEMEADIIGICHYRRYFLNDLGNIMNQADYESALSECDVMTSELLSNDSTNWETYANSQNEKDMKAVGEAIKTLYPQDYAAFCKVLADSKCCYSNLMVTTREKYCAYCAWLFPLLEEAGKHIDVSAYDSYHKRVYGFLSEVLLYVWIIARGYHIREGKIGVTSEKAETMEFKRTMECLIAQGNITQAKMFFYSYLEQRPDIRLDQSDIRGEIPVIEKLLYIMYEEQKAGRCGLLDLSRNLTILMEHYKNIYQIIAKNGIQAREAGKMYFNTFAVSDIAYRIIEQDVNGKLSLYDYLNSESPDKKISVILPVFQNSNTLTMCLSNLLHQTLEDIEIIIIDASKDGCSGLLCECQQQYPKKVQVLSQEMWNAGMQPMTGEYLLFVRGQDLPDVGICEKLYLKAKKCSSKLVGGRYLYEQNEDNSLHGLIWGLLIERKLLEKNISLIRITDNAKNMDDVLEKILKMTSIEIIEDIVYRYCC